MSLRRKHLIAGANVLAEGQAMMSTEVVVHRSDLILPRFLAWILFGLAAFMGLPAGTAALVHLFSGKWHVAVLLTSVLPIVWTTAWIGKILWSGRSIPIWFVFALGCLIAAVPSIGLLAQGEWLGAFGVVIFFGPFFAMLWANLRGVGGKPVNPKGFDDEFA